MSWAAAAQIVERLAGAACLAALAASALYCARKVGQTADKAVAALGRIDAIAETVNRPCGAKQPCGTLGEINKAMVKLQDTSVTLQRQVSQSAKLVDAATESLQSAASDVHAMAAAGTGTAEAATSALGTARQTIAAAQPALARLAEDEQAADGAVTDFDSLLRSPDLAQTLSNAAAISSSSRVILANAATVSTKVTNDFTAKRPWYRKIGPESMDVLKLAGATASLAK